MKPMECNGTLLRHVRSKDVTHIHISAYKDRSLPVTSFHSHPSPLQAPSQVFASCLHLGQHMVYTVQIVYIWFAVAKLGANHHRKYVCGWLLLKSEWLPWQNHWNVHEWRRTFVPGCTAYISIADSIKYSGHLNTYPMEEKIWLPFPL